MHDCTPGRVEWKFDGGRGALLCGKCRIIVGYLPILPAPLPLEDLDRIIAHLITDGTRQGLLHADTLNKALGRSARRRAAQEAGDASL